MTLANKQKVRPEAARLHSFYCRLLLAPRVGTFCASTSCVSCRHVRIST